MGGGGEGYGPYHTTAALSQEEDPVPIVQDAGWVRGLVWMGAENLALPRFDPQTVQTILSPYTDCAILAH